MTEPAPYPAAAADSQPVEACAQPRPRWVCCGSSSNPDAAGAIAEAMTALFPEGLAAVEAPALVIAFLSPAYPMEAMAGELQAALGSVPMIGCSTSGELTDGRSLRHSLVLWALGGAGFSVGWVWVRGNRAACGLPPARRPAALSAFPPIPIAPS